MRSPAAALLFALGSACATSCSPEATNGWRYHVALGERGHSLAVQLTLPPGAAERLAFAPLALPFVDGVTATAGGQPLSVATTDGTLLVAPVSATRVVRWNFDAQRAARQIDDVDVAAWRGNGFVGALGAFLAWPDGGDESPQFQLDVDTSGLAFVCALATANGGWVGTASDLSMLPACAFGSLSQHTVTIGTANDVPITIADLGPRNDAARRAIETWATDAATAIADYFGSYPVPHLLLLVAPGRQREISGMARGLGGGACILVDVPPGFGADELRRDWVLFHEMVHLALPSLAPRHHWLEEGSATYLEPLLQARAGRTTEAEVWRAMLEDYGQGIAAADAGGLDDDHSWGRTYYGGAIFCLRADVEIRRRTDNRRSLQDALRAVVAAGGNLTTMWPIEDVLRTADAATGTTVLADLYAAERDAPGPNDLQPLWQSLGVRLENGRAVFDDKAPLAAVRRALVLGR